jgi:phi13 family phage major tail protein
MAKIGLKYIVAAPITENGTTVSYADGIAIGKAISAGLSINVASADLYADDGLAESVKEFSSGTMTLGVDDLSYAAQALLLGHSVTGSDALTAHGSDEGAYVGVGFYAPVVRGGVKSWRAVWLSKVKFAEPNDDYATKGNSIEFQTPTIEGTVMTASNGVWKLEKLCASEAAAVTWLDTQAGIDTA